eukprot:scaffold173334_cov15-Tisochrysis_lutea.AAC.1
MKADAVSMCSHQVVISRSNRPCGIFRFEQLVSAPAQVSSFADRIQMTPFTILPSVPECAQVLKIKVKYPLDPKPRRDPLFILLEQLARFDVK